MWRVASSRYVLHDRWIRLRADRCLTPDGHAIDPYYTLEYPDFVHVFALTDEKQVVLVRQYRHGFKGPVLELPGGMMDEGETDPALAGARELEEETGYRLVKLEALPPRSTDPAKYANRTHLVLGLGATQSGRRALDPTEDTEVVVMPVPELLDLIARGGFENLSHVGMVHLALGRLGALDR